MKKKYDVCHINSNFEKFNLDFMEALKKLKLDFRVYYFRDKERGIPDVSADYLDIRLNFNRWNRYFFYFKELKVLRDFEKCYDIEEFSLTHAHTLFSNGYIAYKMKKKYHQPYIVAVRSVDIDIFFKFRPYLRNLGLKILLESEKIIFISPSLKDNLFSKYVPERYKSILEEKCEIIPNGINEYFLDNNFYRKDFSFLRKKNLDVITVGRIYERKNQLFVADALNEFMDRYPEYKINYKIIGQVNDQKYLEEISKYDFVEYIQFADKKTLIEYYRQSDLFVMPSKMETFGLTFIEAMSQGLPVIYPIGKGIDGFFSEGEVGYHASTEDIEDLIKKIKLVLENYETISKNCSIESLKFNWNFIAGQYKEIYSGIEKKLEIEGEMYEKS